MSMQLSEITQTKSPAKLQSQQQEIKKGSMDTNNLFNKLIGYDYNSKFSHNDQLNEDLTKFFQMLLWSEKKCPQIIYQLFDMMALQQIQDLHLSKCMSTFFKGYILLLGNCKEGGLIAEQLLQYKIPHIFLQAYMGAQKTAQQRQQLLQYIGSYLKCYDRIFKPEWLQKFIISEDYFELLQICFKLFTCPEPLTRTSAFNIVLDILSHQEVQDFILNNKSRIKFYENMARVMTRSLKNQLIAFGKNIQVLSNKEKDDKNGNFQDILKQLEDLATLWEDISKTCSKIQQIFQLPFTQNIILSLLIGPLTLSSQPVFTIKFSMLVLRRFIKVIKNFDLLDMLIRLIFVQDEVLYWASQIQKSQLKPFNIMEIMDKRIDQPHEEEKSQFGSAIRKFYDGVLRSKDNHFLLMVNSFLNSLISQIQDNKPLLQSYQLQPHGKLNTQICSKLLSQLSQNHRLITIQSILNTVILLNNQTVILPHLQQQFVLVFRKIINECKTHLKNKSQLWDFIVEIHQYQLQKVNTIKMGQLEEGRKIEEIYKLVFLWDIKSQESNTLSFYSSIPDTVEDHFRYLYAKFLILRKANSYFVQGPQQKNLLAEYYARFVTQCQFTPGSVHPLSQIKGQLYQCQILDGKFAIPALWLVDDNFFIVAHWDKLRKQLKIIMTIKYKHLATTLTTKKQKILLSLDVRAYDYKSQRLKYRNSISIKGIEAMMPRIVASQIKIRERQMTFITSCIKKTEETLPNPSLI